MDTDKPLVWLEGEIKTPPMSAAALLEAGEGLRQGAIEDDGIRQ
jgi:hypothetical protein